MTTEDAPDDALLRRYLLGLTSPEETERIDRLSVTSEEFSSRLQSAEYDLVDAYAAGELNGDQLEAFQATYPAVAEGRDEINFAQALRAHQTRSTPRATAGGPAPAPLTPRGGWGSGFGSVPRWPLAIAATIVLALTAYLFIANQALRQDVTRARAERAQLDTLAQTLQQQLDQQRSADADTAKEVARLHASIAAIQQRGGNPAAAPTVIASFLLPPGTRGAGDVTSIAVPPGSDVIRLQLPIEGGRFTSFAASLRDASSNQVLWRGADLHATGGAKPVVAVTFPATLLKVRTYLLELQGTHAGGGTEPLGPYPFQVATP